VLREKGGDRIRDIAELEFERGLIPITVRREM
jgi:DNA-directed RNA polymerase subunit K/omega